jgi:hypothetical protein
VRNIALAQEPLTLKSEIELRSAFVSTGPCASVANEQAAGSGRDAMSATMLTVIFAATGNPEADPREGATEERLATKLNALLHGGKRPD